MICQCVECVKFLKLMMKRIKDHSCLIHGLELKIMYRTLDKIFFVISIPKIPLKNTEFLLLFIFRKLSTIIVPTFATYNMTVLSMFTNRGSQ